MRRPFTNTPADAFFAAETGLAVVLTAAILATPLRSRPATALLLAAIWLALLAPLAPEWVLAFQGTPRIDLFVVLLKVSAGLATAAFVLSRPRWIAIIALLGEGALYFASDYLTGIDWELSVIHVTWFALLYGLHGTDRASGPKELPAPPMRKRAGIAMVAIGTAIAAFVCHFVLHRFANSGDEWAYTYQADVFAHFKAYGPVPPCERVFRSFWVFFWEGRAFSQYTPGWSLVMAPFQGLGIGWLAAPFNHGMLALGAALLARRIAKTLPDTSPRVVSMAGWAAVIGVMGFSALGNAGSRYPHTFITAAFAWSVEALCALTTETPEAPLGTRRRMAWAITLGALMALMISARPADGGFLAIPIGLTATWFLIRRKLRLVPALVALLTFTLVTTLTLYILKLQVGEWLKTGYSLTEKIHGSWAVFRLSLPRPNEWAAALPLSSGAYMWWPAAPALGAAGLFAARKGARRVTFMLVTSTLAMSIFYAFVEFGRFENAGYGSRYHLPAVVPMAVGTSIVFARLLGKAKSPVGKLRPLFYGGAAGAAIAATLVAFVRIVPMTYPLAYKETLERSAPLREAKRLSRGIVAFKSTAFDPMDLTQNLPMYSPPDVLFVMNGSKEELQCVMAHFPDRPLFMAEQQGTKSKISPYKLP